MQENNENKKQVCVSFYAIDQYIEDNIVKPTEKEISGKDFIAWGDHNDYPYYLQNLYDNCATLKSVIDGLSDYICGDEIIVNSEIYSNTINSRGETLADIIRYIAKDLSKFGGFSLNIVRNKLGGIAEIYYLDFKKVRSNKKGTKFYYADDWGKSYGRVKFIEYPSFFDKENVYANSIFYFKNDVNSVYPTPIYSAATIACEIQKKINQYHLNNLNNNFSGNYIVNFNSGQPSDELKEEIENEFYDKFTGVENAGRPMLCFNNARQNETTITKIETSDFADKYSALADRSRQEIFTAFRATPNLFGIPTETTGFSEQEYAEAFKLFNRTTVKPLQDIIIKSFNKIFENDIINIKPFTINFD